MVERLPRFYGGWHEDSLLYRFVDGLGKRCDEARKDLFGLMRAHWVDTAVGTELDQLAGIYGLKRRMGEPDSKFRERIKMVILEYKGGGTVAAIVSLASAFLGARTDEVGLVDNPLVPVVMERRVKSGDSWSMSSEGVEDVHPKVSLFVEPADMYFDVAKFDESPLPLDVIDPVLINMDDDERIEFRGILHGGQELVIEDGTAKLDGEGVEVHMTSKSVPRVSRKGSRWRYVESIQETIGVFDSGTFDSSVFETALATVRLRFSWMAHQLSTFELRIRNEALIRSGLTVDDVDMFLNRIKAAGVKAVIAVVR